MYWKQLSKAQMCLAMKMICTAWWWIRPHAPIPYAHLHARNTRFLPLSLISMQCRCWKEKIKTLTSYLMPPLKSEQVNSFKIYLICVSLESALIFDVRIDILIHDLKSDYGNAICPRSKINPYIQNWAKAEWHSLSWNHWDIGFIPT